MNSEIDPTPPSLPSLAVPHPRERPVDPHPPGLHYMRGPGPKWRAKYRRARNGDGISSPRPIHLVRRIDGRNPHDRSKPRFLW